MTVDEIARTLKASGTKFVQVAWCDLANVIRAKAFNAQLLDEFRTHGVGVSAACQAVPATADCVLPDAGLGPVGEVRLVPDWSTLAPLPYAPGHARVLGDLVVDGRPWPWCPRDFLRRQLAAAAAAGFEIGSAFENEFYLLRRGPAGIEPLDDTLFAQSLGLEKSRAVLDDVAEALAAQGILVEMLYAESGPGQLEMPIRYARGLAAADQQIVFRETVHAIAFKHGLAASFLPKVFADRAGSGCHLHLSLWRGDENVMADAGGRWNLSGAARWFMGGVLEHLPALMAATTPSCNSYRRLQPHCWSGAYRCWGFDNREAALRVPTSPAGPGPSRFELKTCDASSNPYLALGATIAAGLNGIQRRAILPEPVDCDPGVLSDAERTKRGVERLPTTLGEALQRFAGDVVLNHAMGAPLAQAFTAVRRAEQKTLSAASLETEVQLLLERY